MNNKPCILAFDVSSQYETYLQLNDTDPQILEYKKLALIQAIEEHLHKALPEAIVKTDPQAIHNHKTISTLAMGSYYVFILFGLLEKAAGSFLFGSTFFKLLPGISYPLLIVISTIYTLLDSFLFYAFEISFLKNAFGLSFKSTGAALLNEIKLEQLQSVIHINQMLRDKDTNTMDKKLYQAFCKSRDLFNSELLNKQKDMHAYPQSWSTIILQYSVIAFGALTSVTDSYFMAKAYILAIHVSLLSPLGCAVMACVMISGLVYYYAMGIKSVNKLVNPDFKSYESLKKGLTLFKEQYAGRDIEEAKTLPEYASNETETNFEEQLLAMSLAS